MPSAGVSNTDCYWDNAASYSQVKLLSYLSSPILP